MDFSIRKAVGGALLVSGTAIGAGMLALPVVTGQGGFLPATLIFFICWAFSACTGLLLLEVCLWMPKGANLISMAEQLLGKVGKGAAWILYLFLFYCLTIAYVDQGGGFVVALFKGKLSHPLGLLLFSGFFGYFVYLGTAWVDRVNFLLMIGLGLSFAIFFSLGLGEVKTEHLKRMEWLPAFLALPVMFTSFSYQGIIPSLTAYLDRHPRMVRFAILVGTSLPFLAYIVWEYLILGIVPAKGLMEASLQGHTAVEPLRELLIHSPIYLTGRFFSAFALTTSFLGVTLGLIDFLSDGLKIPKVGLRKLLLSALVYLPPIGIAMISPGLFITALGFAGGIGCALLLGLLPIAMVWVGRYHQGYSRSHQQLFGGKTILILLALFVLFELGIELFSELPLFKG